MAHFVNAVTGSTIGGRSFQINAEVVGGIVTGSSNGGRYRALPVAPSDSDMVSAGLTGMYLSSSFGNNAASGSIIKALNFLAARAEAGADVTWAEVSGALAQANSTAYLPNSLQLTAGGSLVVQGSVDLGDATTDTITATARFDSDLVPSTDSARDLGTSGLQWAELHVDSGYIDALAAPMDCGNQAMTNVDINSGAIDGTAIGAASRAAGSFTTLSASSTLQVQGQISAGDHVLPYSDGILDLGSSTKEWKDLYIDGVAYIDSLQAGQLGAALDANSQAITNINVDSGAIDGTVIGANSAANATVDALVATTSNLGTLSAALNANSQAITNINVDSGNIDNTAIGAATPAAGAFTTVEAATSVSTAALTATGLVTMGGGKFTVTSTGVLSTSANASFTGTSIFGENGSSTLMIAGVNAAGANKSYRLAVSGGILRAEEQAG